MLIKINNNHDCIHAGKFPEANTHEKETPPDKQPTVTVKKQDKAPVDPNKGPVAKDSNKQQPTVPVKKQDMIPVLADPKKGQGADSSKHQKLLKTPLPLPSKK